MIICWKDWFSCFSCYNSRTVSRVKNTLPHLNVRTGFKFKWSKVSKYSDSTTILLYNYTEHTDSLHFMLLSISTPMHLQGKYCNFYSLTFILKVVVGYFADHNFAYKTWSWSSYKIWNKYNYMNASYTIVQLWHLISWPA